MARFASAEEFKRFLVHGRLPFPEPSTAEAKVAGHGPLRKLVFPDDQVAPAEPSLGDLGR